MSSELAIRVEGLGKCFQVYETPRDRLKQFVLPRLRRVVGLRPSQHFREFWALQGVSFQVRRGETVGIIGRNGSGKSTLLQILCGTLHASTGVVETQGRVAALLELGSGFNPEFTGRENVHLNAAILGLTQAEINARFDDIVAFADIGEHLEQPVKTFSSGMLVRLAFAVIAHVDADMLVIDEALAVGDAFFTQKCMRFLRNFMQTGTVLFVSHDTGSIRSLCNRAIWLEKGQVLADGDPKEVSEKYLQAFYEAQQGNSTTTRLKSQRPANPDEPVHDQRLKFINASNLRNDLKVFDFNPDSSSCGAGGAQIEDVRLLDASGARLAWLVGGERVTLQVAVRALLPLESPIVGFYIRDKLGQTLFGDNTYLSYMAAPVRCAAMEVLEAEFQFLMPLLPPGNYSVTVAIADGTQETSVQHHWMHDALMFRSENSAVSTGLIGIPMEAIRLGVNVEAETSGQDS